MKRIRFAPLLYLLAICAQAQTKVDNEYFTATFNGEVKVYGPSGSDDFDPGTPKENFHATSTTYMSYGTIDQWVVVRLVDHDIPVDFTSTDFYAGPDITKDSEGWEYKVTKREKGRIQGHPAEYSYVTYTDGDTHVAMFRRDQVIIANSRTVIFMFERAKATVDDTSAWEAFKNSLRIKKRGRLQ